METATNNSHKLLIMSCCCPCLSLFISHLSCDRTSERWCACQLFIISGPWLENVQIGSRGTMKFIGRFTIFLIISPQSEWVTYLMNLYRALVLCATQLVIRIINRCMHLPCLYKMTDGAFRVVPIESSLCTATAAELRSGCSACSVGFVGRSVGEKKWPLLQDFLLLIHSSQRDDDDDEDM